MRTPLKLHAALDVRPWPTATHISDAATLTQTRLDEQLEAEWRRRVRANEMRRLLAVITDPTKEFSHDTFQKS